MAKEIEKKFLIEEIPSDVRVENPKEIHQTYLAIGEEEIRVRKILKGDSVSFTMTIKKGNGLVRDELEFYITEETYQQLLESGHRKPLIKTRSKVTIGEHVFDLDVYHNTIYSDSNGDNLKTIEIEFSSEEEAHSFKKPWWFRLEVTGFSKFKNQNLWRDIQ